MTHLVTNPNGRRGAKPLNGKNLLTRAMGRFYTHEVVGRHLARAIVSALSEESRIDSLTIVEPFAGDGRLVCWLLEELAQSEWKRAKLKVVLWDNDKDAINVAESSVRQAASRLRVCTRIEAVCGDSFLLAGKHRGEFDICITNPPWENLKPDRRELETLNSNERDKYVQLLRERDEQLAELFPMARPLKKFSGWGTNLARCGTEAALRLTKARGASGVVSPASLLGDQMSKALRVWLYAEHEVCDVAYYAAEARLFERVDQACVTFVAKPGARTNHAPRVTLYNRERVSQAVRLSPADWEAVQADGFVLPVQFGLGLLHLRAKWKGLLRFHDLENQGGDGLWAGRELDETNHAAFVGRSGKHPFIKGRMVARFGMAEEPKQFVRRDGPKVPNSVAFHRIVWRDVSRPNQKRRLQATVIPPGWVTGNSLHVAYYRDGDLERLHALLGIVNSLVFESQARAYLATGHVSLGVVRRVHVPDLSNKGIVGLLSEVVKRCISGNPQAQVEAEVRVAEAYGLTRDEFAGVIESFPKLTHEEKAELLDAKHWCNPNCSGASVTKKTAIPNHYAARLSELDEVMVRAVPPGGNWKDIPKSVPSQRLEQIRVSYAAGEGSRSTYYGRLQPNAPAYTINTYFGRPGNGCHLHYDYAGGQHRTISHREAARLQSFPDSFVFHGSRSAVAQQIGNAVPPLLAFQIAKTFGAPGLFLDLFSGAGGMGLGFAWAGWRPIVASDIEKSFLATYRANVDEKTICGDICDDAVFTAIVETCKAARHSFPGVPFFVLGGPPCQGFSTAGNRRSMDDDRNWLFKRYNELVELVHPDAFVFENVPGLMNMEGGRVFEMVRRELEANVRRLSVWKLRAEEYGVPQRRTRVVLVGETREVSWARPPQQVTQLGAESDLFGALPQAVTVGEALSDLPPVKAGEDGSAMNYLHEPMNPYQRLMRGCLTADEYLQLLRLGRQRPSNYKPSSSSAAALT